ncbi:hypothetical protein AAW51_3427 [Caldimonas brevitalea]|uniref:Fibronectin type-III domain-containing protein n=1 Tax=Caldimonas brevitalea TaxID=413882 RepID=A0A0G3BQ56_9BURK|nr:hypothetical protein AAW51_3427 [Caldimonas brevitalea]
MTVTGGLSHRTLTLNGLTPNATYSFNCKAQQESAEQPVTG